MLEPPNFGHMTASTIWLELRDNGNTMDRNYEVIIFLSNTFFLRRSWVANFPDMINIATICIKTTFKISKKAERFRNYVLKCDLYLYLFI